MLPIKKNYLLIVIFKGKKKKKALPSWIKRAHNASIYAHKMPMFSGEYFQTNKC